MYKATIYAGEVPDLRVRKSAAEIKASPDGVLELQPREFVNVDRARDPRPVRARVMDVDWELADLFTVTSADGSVFCAHMQDWDEDHGVLVIELD